jgi:hypothetical protein
MMDEKLEDEIRRMVGLSRFDLFDDIERVKDIDQDGFCRIALT